MMDTKVELGSGFIASVTFSPSAVAPPVGGKGQLAAVAQTPVWCGHYLIDTRRMTSDEIVAEVARLQEHHAAKSAALGTFADMMTTNLFIDGVEYRWRDCRVVERGTNAVALHIDVTELVSGVRPSTMPLERFYPDCQSLPDAAGIAAIVAEAIAAAAAAATAQQEKLARVRAALGLT